METADVIVFELNIMLFAKKFDQQHFKDLWNRLRVAFNPRTGIIDFEKDNEIKLKTAQREKIMNIKNSNFEKAASLRQFQKDCIRYIEMKKKYKIRRSIFIFKDNYLAYVHLGNARNDNRTKEIILSNPLNKGWLENK
jgi:hypothetical protein